MLLLSEFANISERRLRASTGVAVDLRQPSPATDALGAEHDETPSQGRRSRQNAGSRSGWLDALRAFAVIGVVTFHTVQMSPVQGSAFSQVTYYGQYGVDLFFVLSGWLIGTIFWREMHRSGKVVITRFWARRALRTIPPYLVALALSWGSVAYFRGQPFDPGYLLFLQNYYQEIPFFLVSWSLCIEEHFYLFIPALAALFARFFGHAILPWSLFALMCLSPIARFIEFSPDFTSTLGYAITATHLRLDGIALGFWASFAAIRWPKQFTVAASSLSLKIIGLAILAGTILLESLGSKELRYVLLPTALAALFSILVVARPVDLVTTFDSHVLPWSVFRWIGLRSYSTYLIHALGIHGTVLMMQKLTCPPILYWPTVIAMILVGTIAFYSLVEHNAIKLRDALVTR
jgi:peptidoglycan/LPS O-acetylase OafA/YrhL